MINSNSEKVMYERFEQDFMVVMEHFLQLQEDESWEGISYNTMTKLFWLMGFIRNDDARGDKDKMLHSIWKTLGGDPTRHHALTKNRIPI